MEIKKGLIWTVIYTVVVALLWVGLLWLTQTRFNPLHSGFQAFMLCLTICVGVGILTFEFGVIWPTITVVIASIVLLAGTSIATSPAWHAKATSQSVAVSEGADPFPNLLGKNGSTENLPLIGIPEAERRVQTKMSEYPALGSQFEARSEEFTSQNIAGKLCYVVPLQPKSISKWDGDGRGYFMVDRNSGETTFVEQKMTTAEHAPFGDAARRIILKFMSANSIPGMITDISPEVDDEGNFHYVGSVYTRKGFSGRRTVTGVIELDATTRECKFYAMDKIPEYVDRVIPEDFFGKDLYYYGSYAGGFWNSVFRKKGVQIATAGSDVVYIDGICYYYTGWTSASSESSNGVMMMNSRTGEITYTKTPGISEERAQSVAQGIVSEKAYEASYPLMLKVNGVNSYFMLMRDEDENLTGYAFVAYADHTKAAVGRTLKETQNEYAKAIRGTGGSGALNESKLTKVSGKISDIASEVVEGTTFYYLKVDGVNEIFQTTSAVELGIVFAQAGDEIEIEYFDSEEMPETIVSCKLK